MFKKIRRYIIDPYYSIGQFLFKNCPIIMGDKWYLSILFLATFGYKLNWREPKTFNEKLNWLKIYNRDNRYTLMADKYKVKQLISSLIGEQFVIPVLARYNSPDEIILKKLPQQFVLKCNHDSGSTIVCEDKAKFDLKSAQAYLKKSLERNFFNWGREWPYKNIKKCVFAEEYISDSENDTLKDYKWWCFNGKPTIMYITVKNEDVFENFYDLEFNPILIDHGFPRHQPEFERPIFFDKMKKMAAVLSAGCPFVRVDFYEVAGKLYFGEFTFYDWAALQPFGGDWDVRLGQLIDIS